MANFAKLMGQRVRRRSSRRGRSPQDDLKYVTKIVGGMCDTILNLRDNPGILDYVAAATKTITLFQDDQKPSVWDAFASEEWASFGLYSMKHAIIDLLRQSKDISVIYQEDKSRACVTELDGVEFGWIQGSGGSRYDEGPYVTEPDHHVICDSIAKHFWKALDTDSVVAIQAGTVSMGFHTTFIADEKLSDKIQVSQQILDMAEQIKEFRARGMPRSYLFHGPPGTGKSTMMRMIAKILGLRTLRLPVYELAMSNPDTIVAAVETFKPDILLLDDLDRAFSLTSLLDGLEKYREHTGIVLASMNDIEQVPPAVRRPGRFDKVILVNEIDEKVIQLYVDESDPEYRRVKDWPIAFIKAYAEFRDVMGSEAARHELTELEQRVNAQIEEENSARDDDDESKKKRKKKDKAKWKTRVTKDKANMKKAAKAVEDENEC